jgi:enamine deaminase RidA (YjgF/YER057c/UK114 family)
MSRAYDGSLTIVNAARYGPDRERYGYPVNVERINPAELARPSGFSHAVAVNAGRLVFLAGQTGVDAAGQVVPGGVVAQFERALRNLLTALVAAGGQPADLVSMTIYIVDIDAYRAQARQIGTVWRDLAGTGYPATAAVEVSRLWDPAAVVEIQGMAAVP